MPSDITISAEFDAKAVQKEIASLEKEIKKLENKQLPLIEDFEKLQVKVANAKKSIVDAQKALSRGEIDKIDYKLISDEALKNIDSYSKKIEELREKIESFDNRILPLREQLESLKFTGDGGSSFSQIGQKVKQGLDGAMGALDRFSVKVKSTLKSSDSAFGNFGKRISNTFKSAFIFSVLYKGLSELKQRLSVMLSTNQQFSNSLTQVKSNLAVAFQPIYQVAMPAINVLLNLIVKATAYLAAFTNTLFGVSINSSIDAARKMQNTIDTVKSGANGATAAEKALTAAIKEKQSQVKALQRENKKLQREYKQQVKAAEAERDAIQATIDALEKHQDVISKQSSAIQKEQKEAQKAVDEQKSAIDKQIKSLNNQIKALQKKQKEEEKARRANQKFTADFDELSILSSVESEDPYDIEIEQLQEQIDILQERKEAIEDIDYSARLEALDAENEKIQEQIDLLREQQNAIKVAENPLIEQNELLIEQLQEEIDLLQEQKDAIQDSSNTAANFDSSGLNKFKAQIDEIKQKIEESPLYKWFSDNQEQIKQFITIAGVLTGAVLGAYGAFKMFSGILSALGTPGGIIALVVGVLSALIVVGGNGQEVIDHLKESLGYFADALSQFVSGDFEAAKESVRNGFYALANSGIAAAESICNAFQKAINWMIEKINQWARSLPDDSFWKGAIFGTGENFTEITWRAKEVSFPRMEIPALAQGTVIPPNKPFLAWLGDQKNGTNIEAPLSTIEDAVRNVMSEMDFNFNFTAEGSMGAFIRMLNLKLKREGKRETAFG